MSRPHVIVVGSGGRAYREYAFASLQGRYQVSAVLADEPTWQRPYLWSWRTTDLTDEYAVADAILELTGDGGLAGVFTWDEIVLETTARAAEKLSMPHMSARSAARCRDKFQTRSLLSAAGVPAVRHGLARSADEAVQIGDELGYPLVVKPRALAGSVGVVLAEDASAVRSAFELAHGAAYATLPTGLGVLLEEFLDGPEVSVDSVVVDGEVTCVHVAQKRLGFAPYFEEVGHLITGWAHEPWADELRDHVVAAHHALGVEYGVTHAEVRLTPRGPRLVELNGRLGGDFIPYVGRLATGIDLVCAAAEISLGRRPDVTALPGRAAEVRFVYPERDVIVGNVETTQAATVSGIEAAKPLAEPGMALRLPPRQAIPRVAALIAAGDDAPACARALDAAVALVAAEVEPLEGGDGDR